MDLYAKVVIVSDSVDSGEREDLAGPLLSSRLKHAGYTIVEYRAILSARILYLLVSFESEATVEEIKQLIFEHDGQTPPSEWLVDLVDLFRAEEADVDSLLPVIQDAWNYFPHRSLGGRCPAEVMVDLAQPRHARRGRP